MCVVSMVGDHYRDRWVPRPWFPYVPPWRPAPEPYAPVPFVPMPVVPLVPAPPVDPPISRREFKRLEGEVRELIALLRRAKKYDEDNGEPACETDEKMDLLRKVAKLIGVDLDEALKDAPAAG